MRKFGLLIGFWGIACSSSPATDKDTQPDGVEAIAQDVKVKPPPTAKSVEGGDSQTCATLTQHQTKCWGGNFNGELGIGTTGGSQIPPTDILDPGANVKDIVPASGMTCALLKEGAVKCWGMNFDGMLGTGDDISTNAPTVAVPLPAPAKQVDSNGLHACALVQGGDVYCWGSNFHGELGLGSLDQFSVPVPTTPVALPKKAIAIATGVDHVCALLKDGTVQCWGTDYGGQLGHGPGLDNNPSPQPPVPLAAKATAISAGTAHTCALLETGEVQCWGNNADGECGTGEIGGFAIPPSFVINLPGPVSSIACGGEHACAVLADNRMACWGWNVVAQIGVTDFDIQIPTPAVIDVGFPVAAAAGGFTHTCALSTAGEVKCWGSNFSGELGQSCGDGCQATYGITPAQLPNIVF